MQWGEKLSDINRLNKNFIFLKTHMAHCEVNKQYKTLVPNFTKCIIYIYRDPRNVLLSLKDFWDLDIENAKKIFFNKENVLRFKNNNGLEKNFEPILDWASNYKSYKINANKIPTVFVKYEDLVKNTEKEFLKILEFLRGKYISFEINEEKIKNTVNSTTFNKLKTLEEEEGFIENTVSGTKSSKPFFFKGGFREFDKELSSGDAKEVYQNYYTTMKELGYV